VNAFFKISGLNNYIQIVVTILSIVVHLLATRNKNRKETVLELIAIYTIGLAGWFSISSGIFGHILFAHEVASGIGWPLESGFQ
jgi:cyanate permease